MFIEMYLNRNIVIKLKKRANDGPQIAVKICFLTVIVIVKKQSNIIHKLRVKICFLTIIVIVKKHIKHRT